MKLGDLPLIIWTANALLILSAKWCAVIFLKKLGRDLSWILMLAGTIISSIAFVSLLSLFLYHRQISGKIPSLNSGGIEAGNITFVLGLALYAAKASRAKSRVDELELMNLAQATELERLRNR